MSSVETQVTPPSVTRAISRARELLEAWTVEQYLTLRATPKHAVFVDPRDTLGDILRVLAKHNILSTPILERTSGRFGGFVDVGEILGLFVSRARLWLERPYGTSVYGHETPGLPQNKANETIGLYAGALRNANYADADEGSLLPETQDAGMGAGMFTKTLKAARADFPETPPGDGETIFRGFRDASLLAMISAAFLHPMSSPVSRPFQGTCALASNHRVGVYDWDPAFDDGTRIANPTRFEIVSQSDMVRFLFDKKNDANLVEFWKLDLRDAGLLQPRCVMQQQQQSTPQGDPRDGGVLCVDAGISSLSAFALMHSERVSALGVCDAIGVLVGNLSASDLRGITPDTLDDLEQNVGAFIKRGTKKILTLPDTATVGDAIASLVTEKTHHVYVCDDQNKPVAMITPNDVLRVLADVLVEG